MELPETPRTLPIDARVVSFNQTSHYTIDAEDAPYIKEIRGVYLYDKNEVTHCCEITPSYWLVHLYDQVIPSDAGHDLRDEDECKMGDIYQKYEQCGNEDMYVHCRVVDAIEERAVKAGKETPRLHGTLRSGDYYEHGVTGVTYEETPYDEQIEALREHFCGNCVL